MLLTLHTACRGIIEYWDYRIRQGAKKALTDTVWGNWVQNSIRDIQLKSCPGENCLGRFQKAR